MWFGESLDPVVLNEAGYNEKICQFVILNLNFFSQSYMLRICSCLFQWVWEELMLSVDENFKI